MDGGEASAFEIGPREPHRAWVAPGEVRCFERDMTATVAADVTLGQVQEALAAHGQWLPIDGDAGEPVGRLVEWNSTGPLRLGYGAWRDLLLGVQFENGRGELITAGGRTVKNVAGYDLTKFMVGQRGVFGRVVTVTTRTYLRPAGAVVARFGPDVRVVLSLLSTPLRPQWAMMRPGVLTCGWLGDARTIDYYEQRVPSASPTPIEVARRTLEEDAAERAAGWARPPTWRAAVPPPRIGEFVVRASARRWSACAAFGAVRVYDEHVDGEHIREAADAVGGSAWAEDASALLAGIYGEAEVALLRRLKAAFDPEGKLAPLML